MKRGSSFKNRIEESENEQAPIETVPFTATQIKQMKKSVDDMQTKHNELSEKNNGLINLIAQAESELRSVRESLEIKKKELDEANIGFSKTKSINELEINRLEERKKSLSSELKSIESSIKSSSDELKARINLVDSKIKSKSAELSFAQSDLESVESKISILEDKKISLVKEIASLTKKLEEINSSKSEIDDVKKELKELDIMLSNRKDEAFKEVERLNSELEKKKRDNDILFEEYKKSQIDKFNAEMKDKNSSILILEKSLRDTEERLIIKERLVNSQLKKLGLDVK